MQQNEELASALDSHPIDRSPLECEYGLHIAEDLCFGGNRFFAWFPSEAEALDYLRNELPGEFEDGVVDTDALRQALSDALTGVEHLTDVPVESVNKAALGRFALSWAGPFFLLEFGDTPFAQDIQEDFYSNVFGDERGQGPLGTQTEDFASHLSNYCFFT